jgi:hypothetical protein
MDKATLLFILSLMFLMGYIVYIIQQNKNNIAAKFTEKMVLFSSIFIPVGIYLTYTIFAGQLNEMRINATYRMIDRGWLDINKHFTDNYDKCPNLIDSLSYDWQINTLGKKIHEINQDGDDWTASNYVSNCIFQSIEDFMTAVGLDETGPEVWVCNFLPWTNSNILKNNWLVLQSNYSATTIEFVDYLFDISSKNKNKIKNSSDVIKLSKNIVNGETFLNIVDKRR